MSSRKFVPRNGKDVSVVQPGQTAFLAVALGEAQGLHIDSKSARSSVA
jgi:hypothetical protein